MYNPNDDPDITSGLRDDAKKEMTHPGPSESRRCVAVVAPGDNRVSKGKRPASKSHWLNG